MLSLLLALLVTAPPETTAADIITICDTPKLMRVCGLYVRGFLDAVRAQEEVATLARPTVARELDVLVPTLACLPSVVDVDAVRRRIVSDLKRLDSARSVRVHVLQTISDLFPCPTKR